MKRACTGSQVAAMEVRSSRWANDRGTVGLNWGTALVSSLVRRIAVLHVGILALADLLQAIEGNNSGSLCMCVCVFLSLLQHGQGSPRVSLSLSLCFALLWGKRGQAVPTPRSLEQPQPVILTEWARL